MLIKYFTIISVMFFVISCDKFEKKSDNNKSTPVVKPEKPTTLVTTPPTTTKAIVPICDNDGCLKSLEIIKKVLKIDDEEKLIETAKSIKNLDLSNQNLENIDPLKIFTNIKTLNLSFNDLKSVNSINNLSLSNLSLIGCNLQSLDGVEELVNLESLDASFNYISSIDLIKSLNNLKQLDLSGNQISNFDVIENNKDLVSINLAHNKIDVDPNEINSSIQFLYLIGNDVDETFKLNLIDPISMEK